MKNIIITKKNNIEYLQFKKLLEYDNLQHCITLRTGDLDFGAIDNFSEKEAEFIENYKRICDALKFDYNNIIRPKQTHTDNIEIITKKQEKIEIFPEYLDNVDGLITNQKNIILATSYADCIPLMFFDPIKNVIASIHSGWQGTLKKIGKKAVQKMIDNFNCKPENIICTIGPSIRTCHFEVQNDVSELFYEEFKYTNKINEIIKDNKIDTVLINQIILQEIGLKKENIIDSRNMYSV